MAMLGDHVLHEAAEWHLFFKSLGFWAPMILPLNPKCICTSCPGITQQPSTCMAYAPVREGSDHGFGGRCHVGRGRVKGSCLQSRSHRNVSSFKGPNPPAPFWGMPKNGKDNRIASGLIAVCIEGLERAWGHCPGSRLPEASIVALCVYASN